MMKLNGTDSVDMVINKAQRVVVIQADNPDADSLCSSIALEHMLSMRDKKVSMYCGVEIPGYLRYVDGWDRVSNELPRQFDASIFIDASTYTLLEKLRIGGQMGWVKAKPSVVLDHHTTVENRIDFSSATICDDRVSSTGELLFHLAKALDWQINSAAAACLMTAILGDTQGLSNDLATPETYRVVAELLELGVNRPELEEKRHELSRMHQEVFRYKARLIDRTAFTEDGRIATVDVPQVEINTYSPLYNPVPLILNDLLNVRRVAMAIVFKHYDDGKVTGAIRCNNGFPVADKLAVKLNGGGHPYASGFKVVNGRPFNEIKSECIALAKELINNLDKANTDEALQYTIE